MKIYKNFTLLELLIVITVIVILLSLLLPALSKAKQKTQQINCICNLKQLGIAISTYNSDNNDWLPASSSWWCLYPNTPLFPYYKKVDILICPNFSGTPFRDSNYPSWYGINQNLIQGTFSMKLSRVEDISGTIILFDGYKQTISTYWAEVNDRIFYCHNTGVNALFLDIHANWVKFRMPESNWTPNKD